MKKLSIKLLTITTLAFSSLALAVPTLSKTDLAGYHGALQTRSSLVAPKGASYSSTFITVINASANHIYTTVPYTNVNTLGVPESNTHIWNDTWTGNTRLNLQDPYGNTFLDQEVCRLAVVAVYGMPGSYRITIDSSYCNRP